MKVDRLFYRHKNENTTSYFITEYLVKRGNFATQLKLAAVWFFFCTTGKSIEPADLAELVKGAAQCSYRCGEAQWRASR
ncbi:TPA: hypothetical protein GE558_16700 [Escherichia coli]|nr:hypothetical protein [Escherichia coli]